MKVIVTGEAASLTLHEVRIGDAFEALVSNQQWLKTDNHRFFHLTGNGGSQVFTENIKIGRIFKNVTITLE